MTGCIYLLTFANGKIYVGQTIRRLAVRVRMHRVAMRAGVKSPVYAAWRKYGAPQVSVLIDGLRPDELNAAERDCIAALRSTQRDVGYNATAGGDFRFDRTGMAPPNRGACHAARLAGLTTYASNTPCKRGHIGERYVCNSSCVACAAVENRTEAANARKRAWRARQKAAP